MQAVPIPSPKAQPGVTDDGQEMLDGLPIPAAEIARASSGPATIVRANDSFRALARYDERLRGPLVADVPLLAQPRIAGAIRSALHDAEGLQQFETEYEQRYLLVRLARLTGTEARPRRCLLSLVDQSTQVEFERGYAPMAGRDGLTGLPNRLAFEQRVAEVLEHPNFSEGSHALLTVRPSLPPIEMTDEFLIAGARRLLSALRAGDLLARTGPGSFAILTRLEPGQPDARELAQRLRTVLAAPFRLSDVDAQADCSVECAPLFRPA